MNSKIIKVITVFVALLLLVGCGAAGEEEAQPGGGEGREVKVTVIVDNIGDLSYNDGIISQLRLAEEQYRDVEGTDLSVSVYSMNTGMEDEQIEVELAFSEESELILIAYQIALPILEPAAAYYPEKNFILIDTEATGENIYSAIFKPNEAAYLCGFLAAKMSETGIIGIVIGMEIPALYDFCVGYIYGALAADPECKVIVSTVGNFFDAEAGYELAAGQFESGADICFSAAGGAGLGCIEAAKDFGCYSIGVDVDQTLYVDDDLKGVIVTSCLKNFDALTSVVLDEYMAGTLSFGQSGRFGLAEGAVGIARNEIYRSIVSQDIQDQVDAQEELVRSGDAVVRSAFEMTHTEIEELLRSVRP